MIREKMATIKPGPYSFIIFQITFILFANYSSAQQPWKPNTNWGYWILGQKSDLGFLEKNNMTVTLAAARQILMKLHEQNLIIRWKKLRSSINHIMIKAI